jgi:hypothetical protein
MKESILANFPAPEQTGSKQLENTFVFSLPMKEVHFGESMFSPLLNRIYE